MLASVAVAAGLARHDDVAAGVDCHPRWPGHLEPVPMSVVTRPPVPKVVSGEPSGL